jgi:acyl carrier protein
MDVQTFTLDFANQFQDIEISSVKFQTEFRQLSTWDSLTGMAVLVMIEEKYNVEISPADFRNLKTVEDVYKFILSKLTK